jgi:pimeloyl-ACP methyl ester carboxylesterase
VPSKKQTVSRVLVCGILVVTGLYVVCFVGLAVAQRRLLYYPCTTTILSQQSAAAKRGFRPWTNSAGEIIGWVRPSSAGQSTSSTLLLHGNAGCASGWFHYGDGLQSATSTDFYILEYPAYGGRPGSPKQTTILAAADEAMKNLSPTCSVYVIGESLGTGPACYLAGKYSSRVAGILLVAPYNNMGAAAQNHLRFFPVKWILRDKYPSDRWLQNYRGPLAISIGERDTVIPSALGRKLYEGYAGPKRLWVEPNATHDDLHQPRLALYQEVAAFWKEHGQ